MLEDSFYTIENMTSSEEQHIFNISINEDHPIFLGHFPEQPVVPGVCQIQILTEVLSKISERKVALSTAKMIKFMQLIDPRINSKLAVKISSSESDGVISASSTIESEGTVFLKFKGEFS